MPNEKQFLTEFPGPNGKNYPVGLNHRVNFGKISGSLELPYLVAVEELYKMIKDEGLLIRHFATPGIENFVRISIGSKKLELTEFLEKYSQSLTITKQFPWNTKAAILKSLNISLSNAKKKI